MLTKLTVCNFKNFENEYVFDLTKTKKYSFSPQSIKNEVVNNAIIYGPNGVGKSNLGLAIFEIVGTLTDKETDEVKYSNYLNARSSCDCAFFKFEFLINNIPVIYEYKKKDYNTIIFEELTVDGKQIVYFDRCNGNDQFTANFKGTETLNKTIKDKNLSVLKYIRYNSVLGDDNESITFLHFFSFVDNMLYFRTLDERTYQGFMTGGKDLIQTIIEDDHVKDYEVFLNKAGIKCKLAVVETLGKKNIVFDFGQKQVPFSDIYSTGTSALTLFYFWLQHIINSSIPFVFIDEFDAFYHYKLSRMVVERLRDTGVQFVLTTHNISNMTNDLLRPDCYFEMSENRVMPFSELATGRELREAHNIEKMYKAGMFDLE